MSFEGWCTEDEIRARMGSSIVGESLSGAPGVVGWLDGVSGMTDNPTLAVARSRTETERNDVMERLDTET